MKVLVFLDKLVNVRLLGSRKWVTISARVGLAAWKAKVWGLWLERLIDGVFGEGHCFKTAQAEGLIP